MEEVVFPKAEDLGPRVWGSETLLALVSQKYSVKRLEIQAGHKGGLQFHRLKDEVAVMVSGQMIVRYDDGTGTMKERIVGPGDVVHFPPGLVHQEEAITDCVLIEASTPHFNDRVRMEETYGVESSGGLPSTELSEIIER
jgi:mannose-6-phosphate isomerase-like protein (cupin superfamily)